MEYQNHWEPVDLVRTKPLVRNLRPCLLGLAEPVRSSFDRHHDSPYPQVLLPATNNPPGSSREDPVVPDLPLTVFIAERGSRRRRSHGTQYFM